MLRYVEIRDDAVVERTNRFDFLVRALVHVERFRADGFHLTGRAVAGHDGRLVQDNPLVLDVDERVGGAEVDGNVDRERIEHRVVAG